MSKSKFSGVEMRLKIPFLYWLSVIILIVGCGAKSEKAGKTTKKIVLVQEAGQEAPTWQFPRKVIKLEQERYILLIIVDSNGNAVGTGTALRISEDAALTNYHMFKPDCVTYEIWGNGPDDYQPILMAASPSTLHDLVIFLTAKRKDIQKIKLAKSVELGEVISNYSNAGSKNGFYKEYKVAAEDEDKIYMQQTAIGGESGSGLFNTRGELVGIVSSSTLRKNSDGITIPVNGNAVSYKIIKKYLEFAEKILKKQFMERDSENK